MKKPVRGVTLLELIVAIILFGIILLAIGNVEIFSRYHVVSADQRAKLQNEISLSLDQMSKKLLNAIGSTGNWAVRAHAGRGVSIRIDSNPDGPNGMADSEDKWVAFVLQPKGSGVNRDNEIWYCWDLPDGDTIPNALSSKCEIVGHKLIPGVYIGPVPTLANEHNVYKGLNFLPGSGGSWEADGLHDSVLQIVAIARWFPGEEKGNTNPEVIMDTKVSMPSVSTH
jgi:prepilin-type N-terminal cleavage/methylation domain-containing protein